MIIIKYINKNKSMRGFGFLIERTKKQFFGI